MVPSSLKNRGFEFRRCTRIIKRYVTHAATYICVISTFSASVGSRTDSMVWFVSTTSVGRSESLSDTRFRAECCLPKI